MPDIALWVLIALVVLIVIGEIPALAGVSAPSGGIFQRIDETVRNLGDFHGVTLAQRPESAGFNGGEVHEHVLATFLCDEAEPLRIVEPLHGALWHCWPSWYGDGA